MTNNFLNDINSSVKPGEDFYEHAVGTWLKKNPIPPEHSRWGSFEILNDENYLKLKNLLELSPEDFSEENKELFSKIKIFYESGFDEKGMERSVDFLKNWFQKIEDAATDAEFAEIIGELHQMGAQPFFTFDPKPDSKNSNFMLACLWQSGLGLFERDYYLNESEQVQVIREKYKEHIKKMFELFGLESKKNSEIVFRLETELAKVSRTKEELRDPVKNYNKMETGNLPKNAPTFSWYRYFEYSGIVPKEIDVCQPDFIYQMDKLLGIFSRSEIKTYLIWHLIMATGSFLPERFVEERFKFYGQVLQGQEKMKDKWKRVLDNMNMVLGQALGKPYVEKYFPMEAKLRAEKLVGNLLHTMVERIKGLKWMSEETKERAIIKANSLMVKIGYPDKWIDFSTLETGESYLENVILARKFEWRRMISKIEQPVDKTEWLMPPQIINAYYYQPTNEITFPAGILQPPFFYPKGDDALNYGGIGAVIGHEITHAFDDKGRQFDHEGNLRDWWTKEDEEKFNELAKKVVQQFNGYSPLPGVNINGNFTQGENIADLGGLSISFSAFKKVLVKNSPLIDGLTPEQRFFYSYVQTWKTNVRSEKLRMMIMVDPHSPEKFRVIGPLSNMGDFFSAFNVADGDPMYKPEKERIIIW